MNKKATATLIAILAASNAQADIAVDNDIATVDTVIGASAGVGVMATISSWALPAALAHSSGGAILYSGAGYVAGSMGVAAGTVAALPFIAIGAGAVGAGAAVYKYYDEEIDALYYELKEEYIGE